MNVHQSISKRAVIQLPDLKAIKAYPAAFTLIPLHQWDATSKTKLGVVRQDGKRPVHTNWTRRTYRRADVTSWVEEGLNVGVRLTDGQLVIDVDPRNGGDEGFRNLCDDLLLDPAEWPCVRTGSGGRHYYVSKPADVRILDTLKDYPGVEFKSIGRQVVAAGSRHPNGKLYRWAEDGSPITAGLPACPPELLTAITRPERASVTGGGQIEPEQAAEILDVLDVTEFRDHDSWLQLMMAFHHASGDAARQEWIDWSVGDPNYANDAELIGRRWDSLHEEKNDGFTYKTINKVLREADLTKLLIRAGDAPDDFPDDDVAAAEAEAPGDKPSRELIHVDELGLKVNPKNSTAPDTYENAIAAIRSAGLQPCWNDLKQNAEFRCELLPWPEDYGRVLTDHVGRLARHYLGLRFQGNAYSPGKDHLFEAVLTVAYQNKFNPVLDYLDSLKWDGTPRVERLFPDYFHCGDDAYTRAVSRCFLVGAVRRMRKPGCKFDTMPILRSPQGWDKSKGIRTLFGDDWFSDAELGNLHSKDAAMALRGVWVQEFAELEALSRADTTTLKAFTSRQTDRQRDPYGRVVEGVPRRCVFIGTVNEGGYLKDSTGARRFWPLEVRERVDVAALARDRDQLWAEAAALEARGESDVLPQELWAKAGKRQAEQTSQDPWADTLKVFLEKRAAESQRAVMAEVFGEDDENEPSPIYLPPGKVHQQDLFEALKIETREQTRDKSQRLRTAMESVLGWRHRHSVRIGDTVLPGYVLQGSADDGDQDQGEG